MDHKATNISQCEMFCCGVHSLEKDYLFDSCQIVESHKGIAKRAGCPWTALYENITEMLSGGKTSWKEMQPSRRL